MTFRSAEPVAVAAPRAIEEPPPFHFPVVATLAPVLVSVVLWVVTQSPFALMFAALGPVVAVASLADARLQSRRKGRSERSRFAAELERAREEVLAAHSAERAALELATPSAAVIAADVRHDSRLWAATDSEGLPITLGRGEIRSTVRIDGLGSNARDPDQLALAELASRLEGAPVVVDALSGIGVVGRGRGAVAAARAIVLQLARTLSPREHWVGVAGGDREWEWLAELPHPDGPAGAVRSGAVRVDFGHTGESVPLVTIGIASGREELPGGLRTVLAVAGASGELVETPERHRAGQLEPGLASLEQVLAWAGAAVAAAEADGLVGRARALPAEASLAESIRVRGRGPGLSCAFAVGETGWLEVDLVADGPHAIVGGTTGSGKSELLLSWILAMAASRSPLEVTFLLIDFKGGSSFAPLATLPHVVGLVTDLDAAGAARAFESLRAELRHRERVIAEAGARHIDDLPPERLARLVVVVDEFAAMLNEHPDLHSVFADMTARGRSLGVHVILCTQRPAAAARDAVLANADVRISLRVNNRADSIAVVGTELAASFPPSARGRAVISTGAEGGTVAQVALATREDVAAVARAWAGQRQPRRPWCPPLPRLIPLGSLAREAGRVVFGLLDLPAEQRQSPAVYDPVEHGNLLVLGAHRSGRTTALRTIAAALGAGVEWVECDTEVAWDALVPSVQRDPGTVVVLDDLDALVARYGDEHRAAFIDRLAIAMRDGPGRGVRFALGVQRLGGELHSIASLAGARLLLAQANRQDHVSAGARLPFDPDPVPGSGEWRGERVQVAVAEPSERLVSALSRESEGGEHAAWSDRGAAGNGLAVVTTRSRALVDRLGARWNVVNLDAAVHDPELGVTTGAAPVAVVGDPEAWLSHWGALAAMRRNGEVLFDGCSTAEFRALTRSRELPPPISDPRESGWLLGRDGAVRRVRLPRG